MLTIIELKGKIMNQDLLNLDSEQMCCCKCGHIASTDETYETEYPDGEDGEGFPICPKCGEWNTGGCSSYGSVGVWQNDDLMDIIELHRENVLVDGKQDEKC